MRKNKTIILLVIFTLSLGLGAQNTASAQQGANNAGVGSDMRYYKIVFDPTDNKEYATYYQVIREKIKERLSKNYKYSRKAGDVDIFFVLNFDGSLITLDVKGDGSTKDRELLDVAVLSLRQASPFPHLPKSFPSPQASFTVRISFKES